ncbi:MAG TPA: YIP1 family protein [Niabella sp.]
MSKNWKLFFNPFEQYAEKYLLITGISGGLVSVVLFWWLQQTNDGIYHIAPDPGITLARAFIEVIIYTVLLCTLLSGLGKVINPKTRTIDVLSATLIHRIPLTIGILIIQLPFIKAATANILQALKNNTLQKLPVSTLWVSTLTSLLLLAFFVYAIVLLFNGFKTAAHAKKTSHYVLFALVLIIAEIIYRLLLYPLLLKF